jgi:hypothetical protein
MTSKPTSEAFSGGKGISRQESARWRPSREVSGFCFSVKLVTATHWESTSRSFNGVLRQPS